MKPKLYLTGIAIFLGLSLFSQSIDPDSIHTANCGTNQRIVSNFNDAYRKTLNAKRAKAPQPMYSNEVKSFVLQEDFPDSNIIRCGNFKLYYEDLLDTNYQEGFAELDGQKGEKRRTSMCQVLHYVQSIIQIPENDTLDLLIKKSWTTSNPSNSDIRYLAAATPFYLDNTFGYTQGIYAGNVFNHIHDTIDPDPDNYDAMIIVNFDKAYYDPTYYIYPGYYNDTTESGCYYFDLYSILLHEFTHDLGLVSAIYEDTNSLHSPICDSNSFTRYDSLFLYYGAPADFTNLTKLVTFDNNNNPLINPLLSNVSDALRTNNIWLTADTNSFNLPVYAGEFPLLYYYSRSALSHFNLLFGSFTGMAQYLPGYQPQFVMGPGFSIYTDLRRTWSIPEIRFLQNFGYTLTSSFLNSTNLNGHDNNSDILTNSSPTRSNYKSPITCYLSSNGDLPDTITADTIILNYNLPSDTSATILYINITNNLRYRDDDQDTISIYPNSLFGIRGVSVFSNDHDRLIVAASGRDLTYIPAPYFSGRAQFGFYLYDGHMKGAFVVYTIDVQSAFDSLYVGKELIINGAFEDGTELKQTTDSATFNKPYSGFNPHRWVEGEYCFGVALSGAHPLNYKSNLLTIAAGGDMLRNSYHGCDLYSPHEFGLYSNSFGFCSAYPYPKMNPPLSLPMSLPNERYHRFSGDKDFSTLTDSVRNCQNYLINFDISFPDHSGNWSNWGFNIGDTLEFRLDFISDLSDFTNFIVNESKYFMYIVDSLNPTPCEGVWQHFTDTVAYCSAVPAKYVRLVNLHSLDYSDPHYNHTYVFIDNLSLKMLTTPTVSLSVYADTTDLCLGESTTLYAQVDSNVCPVHYYWSTNDTSSSIIINPLLSTTYFVTITTGCSTLVDSIHINVHPIPPALAYYDQPVCLGGTIYLYANPYMPGGSGYTWSGPNGFTSQVQNPIIPSADFSMNGTYYLTVTSDYGCTDTTSINVSIDTTPQPQGNPSYQIACLGDTLFLHADSGYPYYVWWGPDNFGSGDQNPIIPNVTQNNTGYYYLMVYNNSFCMNFDSLYVNATPIYGLNLSTNAPICDHDTLQLFASVADSYLWTGPNGFISYNQNPIILNADDTLNTGWYSCYLQDSSGCHYDSLQVEVLYCCTDTLVTLLSKSKISEYPGSLPLNIAIPSELNIDVNYTFNPGSNIIMLPKSSIRVWSGVNLGIDSSYIHGCTMLWNTINVEDFAGLVLTNSTVEDAEYAVTVNDKPSLNISNNHFHKNYVGLYVTEPSPWDNMRTLGSFTFSGNEFDCQGAVLLKPYTGQISNAGIWLHSELAVSLYGNNINSYHHMKNGILSYNTNLDVLNSKFYHISDSVGTGCGIYAEAYNHPFNLVQKGWGTTIDTTFRHCDIGINAFRMNTAISYNMMHKVKVGIYIMGSPYTYQYMTSNYLECLNYGIVAALNDPVMSMDITENIINMNSSNLSSPSVGIYLFEFRNPPVDFTKIHNNHILMDTCKFGIKLYNSSNSETYENYISMTKPFQNFHGISLEYCPNSFVSCNEVQGINDTLGQMGQLLPRGLNVKECYTSKFSCNSFSNSLVGANFENRCYDDSIRGNTFYNHHYGLHYNKYCITGPQKHQGNKWFGSYYIGAKHDYDTNYQYVYLNPYRMKFNPAFYVPPSFDPLVWITVTPDTTTYFCTTCPKMDTAGSFDSIFSPIDYAIANGLAATAEYQETSQWLSSRFLYNKLLYDTLLVMADSIMQNFYDSIQYVSPGVFQWADLKGKEALHLDQVSKSLVDTLSKQISATLDLIVLTDSLLRTSVSMNDSLELLIEKEMLVSLLENLNSQLAAVMQGLKNVQLTKINTVISQNQILPTTQVYEQNEHVINDIYLNTIAKGIFSFTSNQVAAIASIAIQCPLAGGNAVYQARSLYALVHDTLYDDQLLCYLAGIKQQQIPKDKSTKDVVFRLYPNPTVNSVNIEWKDTKDEKAIIEVVTPLGQLYYQSTFSLSSGSLVVNTTSWRPGVYQVCITYLSKKIYCDKLIIVD